MTFLLSASGRRLPMGCSRFVLVAVVWTVIGCGCAKVNPVPAEAAASDHELKLVFLDRLIVPREHRQGFGQRPQAADEPAPALLARIGPLLPLLLPGQHVALRQVHARHPQPPQARPRVPPHAQQRHDSVTLPVLGNRIVEVKRHMPVDTDLRQSATSYNEVATGGEGRTCPQGVVLSRVSPDNIAHLEVP
jgi:hypothetical protein